MERRVELFAAIRFDWQRYQMPVRALARKYDVHRRTVRQAIASPVPPDRKVPARAAPVREAVAGWIDEILREDLAAPRKQRHTARRVFERLADEHGAQVSYSYVAKYVARRRAEIGAQDRDGAEGLDGFVPQAREPGAEAEVDFGDVTVELGGQLARCFMFACRLSYSGRACHRVFASQAQEAFLEGHVTAFEVMGGVPSRQVRYDNLSPAVAKVLAGRNRTETQRWLAFRAHYGFEAFYCLPGTEGAHEKPRVAYCTSSGRSVRSCGSGWSGVLGSAADLRPVGRVVGVGRVVKELSFVVIAGAGDNSGSAPGLDGVVVDGVGGGGFGEGEHAGVAEALAAAA